MQPLIPAATKKRLFVMRSVEVRYNAHLLFHSSCKLLVPMRHAGNCCAGLMHNEEGRCGMQELHKNLLEEVDDEHIPVEYGGKESRHFYETEHEQAIRRLVQKLGSAAAN